LELVRMQLPNARNDPHTKLGLSMVSKDLCILNDLDPYLSLR